MKYKKLFDFYNKTLFNGVLIKPRIKYWKHKHFLGFFNGEAEDGFLFCTIKLNKEIQPIETLLHEMVHLYQFQFNHNVNHKGLFKAWRRRIKKQTGIDIK